MRPTIGQYLFAHQWPIRAALLGGTFGMMVWTAAALVPVLEPGAWAVVWCAFLIVVSGLLGLLASLVASAVFLPPLYQVRGLLNGAPYAVGDHVRVLVGPHRGRVARVYEVWADRAQVRVELGD